MLLSGERKGHARPKSYKQWYTKSISTSIGFGKPFGVKRIDCPNPELEMCQLGIRIYIPLQVVLEMKSSRRVCLLGHMHILPIKSPKIVVTTIATS
eukprot:jgi/Botrbrau1/20669/Bobra.0058s0003.1